MPGREHRPSFTPAATSETLRRLSASRIERMTASRDVRGAVVSVAGLTGTAVTDQTGAEVGTLIDVVARLYGEERYPPVTGLVVRVGRRTAFLDASAIADLRHVGVSLRSAKLDLRDFVRRPGEVLLARDLLDHQLVDVDGVQVIRAADLFLVWVGVRALLVGVDVSLQSLLRRLGPRRFRHRATPGKLIDWDAVSPFNELSTEGPATVQLRSSQQALQRLRPGELADLLEDLGRPGRQELLASLETERAADALEEMGASELQALLREAEPAHAAKLVAAMEPDEAVDALRELSVGERDQLLERMPDEISDQLGYLLDYRADRAGGFMTSTLVRAADSDSVADVRARLAEIAEHRDQVDAVAVVHENGQLIADVALFDLFTAPDALLLGELWDALDRPEPMTVGVNDDVGTVAGRLIDSRRSSLVVLDDEDQPVGRIMADDVLDALRAGESRRHFPRLLT